MKFKVGDKVKETRWPWNEGVIQEAEVDTGSASGEWYLVDFGSQGNQYTDGTKLIAIETDFI